MAISPQKLQRNIAFAIIMAESTHIFCCILPTVVTVLSVLASLGAVTQVPIFMLDIHEALHHYEIPIITFSGAMLMLGWALYALSRRIDCRKPHCEPHENDTCTPQKNGTRTVLAIASLLFVVNIVVYFTLHRGSEDLLHLQTVEAHHHTEHLHH